METDVSIPTIVPLALRQVLLLQSSMRIHLVFDRKLRKHALYSGDQRNVLIAALIARLDGCADLSMMSEQR